MHNPESVLENDTQTLRFCLRNGSPNFCQTTIPYNNQQKKRELAGLWTLLSRWATE